VAAGSGAAVGGGDGAVVLVSAPVLGVKIVVDALLEAAGMLGDVVAVDAFAPQAAVSAMNTSTVRVAQPGTRIRGGSIVGRDEEVTTWVSTCTAAG
jgi:hypothetical protein